MLRRCLVCSDRAFRLKRVSEYDIWRCTGCGLEFTHPMPSHATLKRFYADYSDPRAQDRVVVANARQNVAHLRAKYGIGPHSRLLDFGCGKNLFVKVAQAACLCKIPAHASGRCMNTAQAGVLCYKEDSRGPRPTGFWTGYDPHAHDESMRALREGSCDAVTLWGVLEHLPHVKETVNGTILGLLRPKGYVFLTTVSSETGIPCVHKPPEHVTYWTRRAIEALFGPPRWKVREYRPYEMFQNPTVYLNCVLRSVPEKVRRGIRHGFAKKLIRVPTNEVFVAVQKR